MYTLLATSFSALKGVAITVAAVNAAVLAAALILLFVARRLAKKGQAQEEPGEAQSASTQLPKK